VYVVVLIISAAAFHTFVQIQLVIQTEPPRNLESYIHRSGRTGRAGKSGTCITLYTNPDQMRQISLIEKEIGLKMTRAGAPQASTLVQATVSTTRHMLNNVSESAATHYTEVAKSLAEEHGGVAALARALALVGGAKSLTPRSLLDGTLGRVTMMLHSSKDLFKTAAHARRLVEPLSPSICDQSM
jgi:ATP-dependent RNA helicase DDX21